MQHHPKIIKKISSCQNDWNEMELLKILQENDK